MRTLRICTFLTALGLMTTAFHISDKGGGHPSDEPRPSPLDKGGGHPSGMPHG